MEQSNRMSTIDITIDSEDGGNQVLVVKRASESVYSDSFLVNRLDLFGELLLYIRKDMKGILIIVERIVTDKLPFYAFIGMWIINYCFVNEDCESYDSCADLICSNKESSWPHLGTCTPTTKEYSLCRTNILPSVTTNENPNYL